jgi:hypothetical protein
MFDPTVVSSSNRVAAQKLLVRKKPFGCLDNRLLGASNVREHRVGQCHPGCLLQGVDDRLDRNACDDKISVLGSDEDIVSRLVNRTTTYRSIEFTDAPTDSNDMFCQPFSMQGQPYGASKKPNSNDAYSLKNHETCWTIGVNQR